MSYEVIFSPKSYKQIKSFDEKLKGRIKQAAIEMGNDPQHKGTIKVEGYENVRRKRVGKYRLLYAVDRHRKEVLVVKIEIKGETTYRLQKIIQYQRIWKDNSFASSKIFLLWDTSPFHTFSNPSCVLEASALFHAFIAFNVSSADPSNFLPILSGKITFSNRSMFSIPNLFGST